MGALTMVPQEVSQPRVRLVKAPKPKNRRITVVKLSKRRTMHLGYIGIVDRAQGKLS